MIDDARPARRGERKIVRGTFTDEEKRIADISDRLVERGLWSYVKIACDAYHVLVPELLGESRLKSIVAARHYFWRQLHDDAELSWTQIATLLGKRYDSLVHSSSYRETRARRAVEDRVSSQIATWLHELGEPRLAARCKAGAWRPARESLRGQGEALPARSGKASPGK